MADEMMTVIEMDHSYCSSIVCDLQSIVEVKKERIEEAFNEGEGVVKNEIVENFIKIETEEYSEDELANIELEACDNKERDPLKLEPDEDDAGLPFLQEYNPPPPQAIVFQTFKSFVVGTSINNFAPVVNAGPEDLGSAVEGLGGCYHGKLRSSLAEERLKKAGNGAYLVRKSDGIKENHKFILSTLSKGQIKHTLVPTEHIKVKDVLEDVSKLVTSCSHKEDCQKPLQRPESDGYRHYDGTIVANPLACYICSEDVLFEDSKAKEKHVRSQHRVRECFYCGGFFSADKHQAHTKKCLLQYNKLKCETCDFSTYHVKEMENHKNTHQRNFNCLYPGCGKVFPSLEERRKHRDEHHSRFSCRQCGKGFTRSFNLERHVNTKHWNCEGGGEDGDSEVPLKRRQLPPEQPSGGSMNTPAMPMKG